MVFCKYKAVNMDGTSMEGQCWCNDREELARAFRDKGYYLVSCKEIRQAKVTLTRKKLSLKEISVLCHQFAAMISSGINIAEAINILGAETQKPLLKRTLVRIEQMVQQGVQLSSCLQQYLGLFPVFMINMIKVGEESGTLGDIFESLSDYYNRESAIRSKLVKALSYPLLILLVSIIVVQIMFIYVIPTFTTTIGEIGGSIPQSTKNVLVASNFFRENYSLLILFMFLVIITFIYLIRIETVKLFFQRMLLQRSFVRDLGKKLIAVKFSRTVGILINSGVPIVKALAVTREIIGMRYAQEELEKCEESIKKGSPLSKGLRDTKLFPSMFCSMVRIGEESGTLTDMLLKASLILEEELVSAIEKATSLIEPVLVVIVSIFVGGILISVVEPMFNITDII